MLKVCGLYWSLGQEEQAYLIQCLKEEAGCTASPVDTDRQLAFTGTVVASVLTCQGACMANTHSCGVRGATMAFI